MVVRCIKPLVVILTIRHTAAPLGQFLTPFLRGFKDFSHLSFASTLCGKCVEVCPVKIPLTDILLANRRKTVELNLRPLAEKILMRGFRWIGSKRIGFDIVNGNIKTLLTKPLNKIGWGPYRSMPEFSKKSFSQLYKEKNI